MRFRCFFFLLSRLLSDSLYLLSLDQSDLLNDKSEKLGSDSGPYDTYSFYIFSLCFDDSVGSVSVLGSGSFEPTGVDFKGDIFASEIFVPTGVEYKGGRLLEIFWGSNYFFLFQI